MFKLKQEQDQRDESAESLIANYGEEIFKLEDEIRREREKRK